MNSKPRIAWFSALNLEQRPSSLVSAYCTDLVLPYLKERFEIELFDDSSKECRDSYSAHVLNAFKRDREAPFDIWFYQLEDDPRAQYSRVVANLMPGIVWFHDVNFRTFGPEPILNSPWQKIVERYRDRTLPWPERLDEQYQSGPFCLRECSHALVPLFSSQYGHVEYQRHQPSRLLREEGRDLPTSWFVPLPIKERERSIVSNSGSLQIAFCGSPQIDSRAHKLLQALSLQTFPFQLNWLVESKEADLAQALLNEFGIEQTKLHFSRSADTWAELVQQSDVAVHTSFSVYGHLGPYLNISLGLGVPVLVSRFGEGEFLPDQVVFAIEPGDTEAFEIREVLRMLAERSQSETFLNREYALENFSAEVVAQDLKRVFELNLEHCRRAGREWRAFQLDARRSLVEEVIDLVDSRETGPIAGGFVWELACSKAFEDLGWRVGASEPKRS